jgi:hypothetical protein
LQGLRDDRERLRAKQAEIAAQYAAEEAEKKEREQQVATAGCERWWRGSGGTPEPLGEVHRAFHRVLGGHFY